MSEEDRIKRLIRIANEVVGHLKTYRVTQVGIEGFAMNARFRAHQLGELAGVVKTQIFMACGLVPTVHPPGAPRKHVMGYGNPDKSEVLAVVRDGLGFTSIFDDNVADAAVVARYTHDIHASYRAVGEEP